MARRHRTKRRISENGDVSPSNHGADTNAPTADDVDASSNGAPPDGAIDVASVTSADRTVLGYVNFDGKSGDGNTSTVLIDSQYLHRFRRGRYVTVENYGDSQLYLGRVVEGPYFSPDFVGLDSAIARVAIQKAASISMLPDYHAYAAVEILGKIDAGDTLLGISTRPYPKSKVQSVEGDGLTALLNIGGDLRLGRLDGYDDVEVRMDSTLKKTLPRNIGIFGTVGSGKTNTAQVLIEEAAAAKWAVIVLDIEGEYTAMDEPTKSLLGRLNAVGKEPKGLGDFRVLYPVCAPPDEPQGSPFSVSFGGLPAPMIAELVGMNDAQQERFFQLYDACVRENAFGQPSPVTSKRKSKHGAKKRSRNVVGPASDEERAEAEGTDNSDSVSLSQSIEEELTTLELLDEAAETANVTLHQLLVKLLTWLRYRHDDFNEDIQHLGSWNKVKAQLRGIQRLGLFDASTPALRIEELLFPGRVSVINLSDSADPRVNNIVIAEVLRSVFSFKKTHPEPKTLIVIEEAHTFVSKDNVTRMQATMDKLREIARRGRKRWLGLTFVSQQPSHLPNELYELCNTLFVHETNGKRNTDALKSTAGTINEGIWHDVPVLGQGRSVIVSPQYKHPIVVQIDPCTTMRRMVD